MALISCRECGKEISDQATACPHCGAPVKMGTANKYGEPGARVKKSPWPAVALVVVVGAMAVYFSKYGVAIGSKEPDYEFDAKMACKEEIKRRLNDPGSAEFPDASRFIVTEIAPKSSYIVNVEMRAKNGFDALRLVQYKCAITELSYPPEGGYRWRGTAVEAKP